MSPHRHLIQLLAGASILALTSCKSPSEVCNDPGICGQGGTSVATTVNLTPATATLSSVGATQQLTASVLDQNGQPMTSASVTWSSAPTTVATVSGTGLVTAAGLGGATVTATSGSASGTASITVVDACAPVGTVSLPSAKSASLTASDCVIAITSSDVDDGDHYAHTWTLEMAADGFIQIDLISSDFDAYMELRDNTGNLLAFEDDSHSTGVAEYDHSPHLAGTLDAGTYRIIATTYNQNATGAYYLYVGEGLPCPEIGHVSSGSSVMSSLDAGDCSYNSYYAEPYVIQVTTTGTVTFDMTSVEVDSYLTLYDAAGHILDDDDDGGGGLDASISMSLSPGWYVIEASSSFAGEVGAFTLSVN